VAQIDLSELFTDGDLCDSFQVMRRQSSVDLNGIQEIFTTQTFTAWGSVQPLSSRTLQIMPDLVNAEGAIEIWTSSDIRTSTKGFLPDLIPWQGALYEVIGPIQGWQNFGGGFTHLVATLFQQTGDLAP
jgi:hypothetical protein